LQKSLKIILKQTALKALTLKQIKIKIKIFPTLLIPPLLLTNPSQNPLINSSIKSKSIPFKIIALIKNNHINHLLKNSLIILPPPPLLKIKIPSPINHSNKIALITKTITFHPKIKITHPIISPLAYKIQTLIKQQLNGYLR
jgi:hypothetical protein